MFARSHGDPRTLLSRHPVMIDGAINPLAFAAPRHRSLTLNIAPSQQATLQEKHQFSPNILNQLALGYTRFFLRVATLAKDTIWRRDWD